MTQGKQRVTVTVDPALVEAGNRAVAGGAAGSFSAWVNTALADRARRDEQLAMLGDAIADYEAEFGVITADEIASRRRTDREQATVVRGRRSARQTKPAKPT